MTTYKINFYPGYVLPSPYYLAVSRPTTDYQALLDILVDTQLKDCEMLFDDDEECADDEVTIAGNECRRLITGGMLSIEKVTSDDVKALLQERAGTDYPLGQMQICYGNSICSDDYKEILFEVSGIDKLVLEWTEYCTQNNLDVMNVLSITIFNHNRQLWTERGTVHCVGCFSKSDLASEAGFTYCFHSTELNVDLYSKILDVEGKRRNFVMVTE